MQSFYFIVTFNVHAGKEAAFRRELAAIAGRLRQTVAVQFASGLLSGSNQSPMTEG